MKAIMVVNQKGGVGKSTLVVNLAHYFAKSDLKIAVLDMDEQGDSSYSLESYANGLSSSCFFSNDKLTVPPPSQNIALFSADDGLISIDTTSTPIPKLIHAFSNRLLQLEKQGFDYCFLDSSGKFGIRLLASLRAVDYVLTPIEVEAFAIRGIQKLVQNITNAQEDNPKLKLLGLVVNRYNPAKSTQQSNLQKLKDALGDIVIPVTIGVRVSIADASAMGIPIWNDKRTAARKAKEELKALAELLLQKIQGDD